MDRSGSKFYWPIKVDRQKVLRSDILCIMPTPPVPVSSRLFVVENNANIDKLFKEQ